MKQLIDLLRKYLATPFLIIGSILFRIGEFIVGIPFTYRYKEVEKILIKTMVCSKCGHKGE